MKFVVVALVCISAVSAVKPRFNAKFQRQVVPHTVYGPPPEQPPQEYGPPPEQPPQEYGPPPQETTTAAQDETTTTEVPTTTEENSEPVNTTGRSRGRLTKGGERGVYYIYHPTGQLQRVVYSTKKDSKNRAYTAQVKYEDVEPIKAPIFTYDPKTLVLTPLQP